MIDMHAWKNRFSNVYFAGHSVARAHHVEKRTAESLLRGLDMTSLWIRPAMQALTRVATRQSGNPTGPTAIHGP